MLAAVAYRGDSSDRAVGDRVGLGYRSWAGRPGKSIGVHRDGADMAVVAGSFAPPVASPAAVLGDVIRVPDLLATLDGNFGAAHWDNARRRLTLLRDPFGVRSMFTTGHNGVFYFASELKQLLAIPGLAIELDPVAVHKYLTFSFVPGEDVPVRGIKRLLPGRLGVWEADAFSVTPYFELRE